MDAAEIARLRRRVVDGGLLSTEANRILDALEQAQKERDDGRMPPNGTAEMAARSWLRRWVADYEPGSDVATNMAVIMLQENRAFYAMQQLAFKMAAERDQAQKDAKDARALLAESKTALIEHDAEYHYRTPKDFRARIEAMLTPQRITTKGDQT